MEIDCSAHREDTRNERHDDFRPENTATGIAHGHAVITANTREFQRFPGLRVIPIIP